MRVDRSAHRASLLLALCLGAWLVLTAVTGPASAEAANAPSPDFSSCGSRTLAVGHGVAVSRLGGMQFLTPERAVAVTSPSLSCGRPVRGVSHCLPMRFATTTDGGQKWLITSIVPDKDARPFDCHGPQVSMVFLSRTEGWLMPTTFPPGFVYATTDGGRHWRHLHVGGLDLAIGADGNNVALAATNCLAPYPQPCPAGASLKLWTYSPTGRWNATSSVPVPMMIAPTVNGLLVGTTPGQAYLSVDTTVRGAPNAPVDQQYQEFQGFYGTSDAGVHWTAHPHPCPTIAAGPIPGLDETTAGPLGQFGAMALSPSGDIWMVCHSEPGAGELPSAIFVSGDGGASWDPRLVTIAEDVFPVFAVVSEDQALWSENVYLAYTTDGGRSWSPTNLNNGGGPEVLSMLSPHDIWVLAIGGSLYHSTDGAHFVKV